VRRGGAWVALLIVWVVWGSTYLAIRVAVESLPPLLMAGGRFVIAGLIMFPVAVRAGRPSRVQWPTWPQWRGCVIVGILLLGANGALSFAERTVPSGLASLLIATVPLWLLGFDAGLNRARLGWAPVFGLLVGLVGVGFLSGSVRGSVSVGGVVICLCAAASWALGTILSRRVATPANPALGSSMQMITAGAVLLAVAAASGESGSFHPAGVTARSWLALGYLVVVGSIVAFSAYVIAVRKLPTATVATYAYVNPVIAVLLGTTLLGERLTPSMLVGGALIVGAVVLVVRRAPVAHLRSPLEQPGQQDGDDSGHEYAVERAGAADRGERRAQSAYLAQVGEVRPDQGAERAGRVGEPGHRGGVERDRGERGEHTRQQRWDGDAEAGHGPGHQVNEYGDDGGGGQRLPAEAVVRDEVGG
jgi:drug/metabolite transporter (DMT)-like permease